VGHSCVFYSLVGYIGSRIFASAWVRTLLGSIYFLRRRCLYIFLIHTTIIRAKWGSMRDPHGLCARLKPTTCTGHVCVSARLNIKCCQNTLGFGSKEDQNQGPKYFRFEDQNSFLSQSVRRHRSVKGYQSACAPSVQPRQATELHRV
jgi:hypothetical protein